MRKPLELFWKLAASDEVWGTSLGSLRGRDALLAGSKDGTVYLWGHEGYFIWKPRKLSTSILDVAFGKLGKHSGLIISTKNSRGDFESDIYAWDEEGKLLWKFRKEYAKPTPESFRVATGKLGGRGDVVVAGSTSKKFKYLKVWNEQGRVLWKFRTHMGGVNGVAVGRLGDSDVIAATAGSKNHCIYVWDERGIKLWDIPVFETVGDIAVGKFGRRDVVVTASKTGNVYVWDQRGRPLMKLRGPKRQVNSVDLGSFGGRDVIVAGSKDSNVYVWDSTGALLWKLSAPSSWIWDVSVGSFGIGDVIAAGSKDGYVYVWGMLDDEEVPADEEAPADEEMPADEEVPADEEIRCTQCGTKNKISRKQCISCSAELR